MCISVEVSLEMMSKVGAVVSVGDLYLAISPVFVYSRVSCKQQSIHVDKISKQFKQRDSYGPSSETDDTPDETLSYRSCR